MLPVAIRYRQQVLRLVELSAEDDSSLVIDSVSAFSTTDQNAGPVPLGALLCYLFMSLQR
jgi:hypothetical protein